ncbi:MAG TPA: FAD-binding oxidoreductase [Longimicrobiales bacterium]|nr:FAD-binding oxidoreductase [Longimicrobiales bacterium]
MTRPDAVVVGAGVVGAAVAWHLARDGHRVDVLEAGFPGCGATGGGMGHIVVLDDSPAQLALCRYSAGLIRELAAGLAASVELDRCGTLWVAEDEAQLDAAARRCTRYREAGLAAELLDAASLAEAEPELRPGLAGALLVPGDGVVYPPALCRWLLEQAAACGARVRTGAVVTGIDDRGVTLQDGRLDAGIVVNAAGAAAPALTRGLGIVPRKGHLVITDRYPGFCRHQLAEMGYMKSAHDMTAASVAFNIQPRLTGQVLVGSSRELTGWDARVDRAVTARMLARAAAFVPGLRRLRAIRTWTAFRPATPDGLPYIGPWGDGGRTWVAAGHEGLGITTALGTGRVLADLVAGRAPAIDPAPYAPMRSIAA